MPPHDESNPKPPPAPSTAAASRNVGLDDRIGTATMALLVLAAFIAAVVVVTSDFHDLRPLYNGWYRLTFVGGCTVVLLLGSVLLRKRVVPRLQLCVALSLLIHLLLVLLLHSQYLRGILLVEREMPSPIPEEMVTLPDYSQRPEDLVVVNRLARPAKTTTPDRIVQDVTRPAVEQQGASPEKPPTPEPEVTPARLPNPNDTARPEVSPPRSTPTITGVERSRRETEELQPVNTPIPLPSITARSDEPEQPEPQPEQQQRARESADTPAIARAATRLENQRVASLPAPVQRNPRQTSRTAPVSPQPAPTASRRPSTRALDVPLDATVRLEEPVPASAETGQPLVEPTDTAAERTTRLSAAPGEKLDASDTLSVEADLPGLPRRASAPAASSRAASVRTTAPLSRPNPIAKGNSEPALAIGAIRAEAVEINDDPGANESEPIEASSLAAIERSEAVAPARGASPMTQTPGLDAEPLRPAASRERARSTALDQLDSPTAGLEGRLGKNDRPEVAIDARIADTAGGASGQAEPNTSIADSTTGGGTNESGAFSNDQTGDASDMAVPEPGTADSSRPSAGENRLADLTRPSRNFDLTRPSASATRVDVPAPSELGGLSTNRSRAPGIQSARLRPDSPVMRTRPQRFLLEESPGRLAIDGRIDEGPTPAYRNREPRTRSEIAREHGGSDASERAVEMGLAFLASIQAEDGHWSLQRIDGDAGGSDAVDDGGFHYGTMNADTAATGLALLAFLGAGYTHQEAKYGDVVTRALDHLIGHQKENGDLFSGGSRVVQFYSHGIAAIALCEAYGMTRDKDLRGPALKALEFILNSQHPQLGGWRYHPRRESDTSVSGWQLMALKSGELAGLPVPARTYDGVERWLNAAAGPRGDLSRYVYMPGFLDRNEGRPSLAMTAEGLLMRLYLGWDRTNPNVVKGGNLLAANLPQTGDDDRPTRDAYYWYYATQVMFELQGDHWRDWNNRLRELLVTSQVQDGPYQGSWEPDQPVPDRWATSGGRLYVTAMHLLMLEVYYRHLPLYQTLEE